MAHQKHTNQAEGGRSHQSLSTTIKPPLPFSLAIHVSVSLPKSKPKKPITQTWMVRTLNKSIDTNCWSMKHSRGFNIYQSNVDEGKVIFMQANTNNGRRSQTTQRTPQSLIIIWSYLWNDFVAERLRRLAANEFPSGSRGSNPLKVDTFYSLSKWFSRFHFLLLIINRLNIFVITQ